MASKWQTINGAPRDGSDIFVGVQHRRDGHWQLGAASWGIDEDGEGWRWSGPMSEPMCEFHPPDYWQPLADPDPWPPRLNRYGELE